MLEIIGLDFDGLITDPSELKKNWVWENLGLKLSPEQTPKELMLEIIGKDEYRRMIHQIYVGDWALRNKIRPEAVAGINALGKAGKKVHIVTSREDEAVAIALELMRLHQVVVDGFHNTNEHPKLAVLQKIGAEAYVDDSLGKLMPLMYEGIELFFFNEHGVKPPFGLTSVINWEQLMSVLLSY